MKYVISTFFIAHAVSAHAMTLRSDIGIVPEAAETTEKSASGSLANFVPVPTSRKGNGDEQDVQDCTKEFDDKCGDRMEAVKDAVMDMDVPRLLRSAMGLVECLGENADDLWKHCRPMSSKRIVLPSPAKWSVEKESVGPLASATLGDHNKCHEEWREECGKQADKLRTAVQNADIAGVVMAAMEVVQCAHENIGDLRRDCLPFEVAKPAVTAVFVAPPPPDALLLREADVTGVRDCTKEFDDKCGKNLEQLKNAILSFDFMRLLHASVGLIACSAENGQDIWEHCKPGKGGKELVVIPTLQEAEAQRSALEPLLAPPPPPHHRGGPGGMMKHMFSKVSSFVNNHRPGHHDEDSSSSSSSRPMTTVAPPPREPRPAREPEPEVPMAAPMMPMPIESTETINSVGESKCKKEWEEDCGDKVENLKKRVEEGDVMGILSAAVGVVQCATEHVQDLKSHCKPFSYPHHHHGEPMEPHDVASLRGGWSNVLPPPPPPEFMMVVQRQSGSCYDAVIAVCGAQVAAIQSSASVTSAQLDALESCLLDGLPKIEALCAEQQQQQQTEPMPPRAWGHGGGPSGCLHRAMHKHARVLHAVFAFFLSFFAIALLTRLVKRAYRCHAQACDANGGGGECCGAKKAKVTVTPKGEASYVPLVEKSELGPNAV